MELLSIIEEMLLGRGACTYVGAPDGKVTALAHALQCAQLAEWADADHPLVLAALLHDLGQLVDGAQRSPGQDNHHELLALGLLAGSFGPEVLEPIRLHVQAKRYLVTVDARYAMTLSPLSLQTLQLQGGQMNAEEKLLFMAQPHARDALQLRRWDDLARVPGKCTPPLRYYLDMMENLIRTRHESPRLAIA